MHSRKPSINSQAFAVPTEDLQLDDDTNSTDSYQDSVAEDEAQPKSFDPVAYLTQALESSLSNLEFNNSMVLQARTSGTLKSKEIELAQLQLEAQQKLKGLQKRFKEGLRVLQQVSKDLNSTKRHIQQLQSHVKSEYPVEYAQAMNKVLSRNLTPNELSNDADSDEIYI